MATKSKTNQPDSPTVRDIPLEELQDRAGVIAHEAMRGWSPATYAAHYEDMKQTALLEMFEYADNYIGYAYQAARTALKNYKWIHIRGLNGGWRALDAQKYKVEEDLNEDGQHLIDTNAVAYHVHAQKHSHERIPRPTEWEAFRSLLGQNDTPCSTEDILNQILPLLAGLPDGRLRPDSLYRGAIVAAMIINDYTWEEIEQRTGLSQESADRTWFHYKTWLLHFTQLSPMHQELIRIRGKERISPIETAKADWLNTPVRKMVLCPTGLYTITYHTRASDYKVNPPTAASLMLGKTINGRMVPIRVRLGNIGELTIKDLEKAVQQLEDKLLQHQEQSHCLGQLDQTHHHLFAPIAQLDQPIGVITA